MAFLIYQHLFRRRFLILAAILWFGIRAQAAGRSECGQLKAKHQREE
jgi:hypothetical protein